MTILSTSDGNDVEGTAPKCVDLARFKNRHPLVASWVIFYLSEKGEWLSMLSSLAEAKVLNVQCLLELEEAQAEHTPDLIFIESSSIYCLLIDLSERCIYLSHGCSHPLFSSTPKHFRLPGEYCLQS